MQVEIWSDIACPWCAVGSARFAEALAGWEHADTVEVRWRSFELDPSAPATRDGDYATALATKYGVGLDEGRAMIDRMTATAAEAGVELRFDRIRPGNTFDAHRLVHLAHSVGRQHEMKQAFLTAYLTDGEAIGDHEALRRVAVATGLDAAAVDEVLATDRFAEDVRADERLAGQLGITAVPFFVVDRRFGVAGAQTADVLRSVLERARAESAPLTVVGAAAADAAAPGCDGDTCAV